METTRIEKRTKTVTNELNGIKRLLSLYPTGILSMVSDTFDLWRMLTEYLPALKDQILARNGKLVIRPDSGDPADIICGRYQNKGAEKLAGMGNIDTFEKYQKAYNNQGDFKSESEFKGVIELLWDIFGGTINEKGYKCLDSHIGAIYGDSITLERAKEICERLKQKGFASTNVVLGIGSYTYQYNTRDTFGFAIKATYGELTHTEHYSEVPGAQSEKYIEPREIFKDPITDDGTKKSAKGLLRVENTQDGLKLYDQCDWLEEQGGELKTVFKDGKLIKETTLQEIRDRLKAEVTIKSNSQPATI